MNKKSDIHNRNVKFLKKNLGISFDAYLQLMTKAGRPIKFGDKWSAENPTAGRCGSVVNALRLSGKVPNGYTPCWQKSDDGGTHYYFINKDTNEVIDPTCYQMDYYIYKDSKTSFLPQVGNNVKQIMKIFNLKIDNNIFEEKIVNNTLIVKKKT